MHRLHQKHDQISPQHTQENPLDKKARNIKKQIQDKEKEFLTTIERLETKSNHYNAHIFSSYLYKTMSSSRLHGVKPQETVAELKRQFTTESAKLLKDIDENTLLLEKHLRASLEIEKQQQAAFKALEDAQNAIESRIKQKIIDKIQEAAEEYKQHLIVQGIWGDEQSEGFKLWVKKGFNVLVRRYEKRNENGQIEYLLDRNFGTGVGLPFDLRANTDEPALHPTVRSQLIQDICEQNSLDAFIQIFNQIKNNCKEDAHTSSLVSRFLVRTTYFSYAFHFMKQKQQQLVEEEPKYFEIKPYHYLNGAGKKQKGSLLAKKAILPEKDQPVTPPTPSSVSSHYFPQRSSSRSTSSRESLYSPSTSGSRDESDSFFSYSSPRSESPLAPKSSMRLNHSAKHLADIKKHTLDSNYEQQQEAFQEIEQNVSLVSTASAQLIKELDELIKKMEETALSLQRKAIQRYAHDLGASTLLVKGLEKFKKNADTVESQLTKTRELYLSEAKNVLTENETKDRNATLIQLLGEIQPFREDLLKKQSDLKAAQEFKENLHRKHQIFGSKIEEEYLEVLERPVKEQAALQKRQAALDVEYKSAIHLPKALTRLHNIVVLRNGLAEAKKVIENHASTIKTAKQKITQIYTEFGKEIESKDEDPYLSELLKAKTIRDEIEDDFIKIQEKITYIKKIKKRAQKIYTEILKLFSSFPEKHPSFEFYKNIAADHQQILADIELDYDAAIKLETAAAEALEQAKTIYKKLERCNEYVELRERILANTKLANMNLNEFFKLNQAVQNDVREVKRLVTLGRVDEIRLLEHTIKTNCELATAKLDMAAIYHDNAERARDSLATEERMEEFSGGLEQPLRSNFEPLRNRALQEFKVLNGDVATAKNAAAEYKVLPGQISGQLQVAGRIRDELEDADRFVQFFYDFVRSNLPTLQEDVAFSGVFGGVPVKIIENGNEKTYRLAAGIASLFNKAREYVEEKKAENAKAIINEGKAISQDRMLAQQKSACRYKIFNLRGPSTIAIYNLFNGIDASNINFANLRDCFTEMKTRDKHQFNIDESKLKPKIRA